MAGEQSFFQKMLGNFTHEFANGDLIRKYADQGCSVKEIRKKLDFPSPLDKIHEMVWKHFLNTCKILLEPPGEGEQEIYKYVKDVSPYGKVSFRRIKVEIPNDALESSSYKEITMKEVMISHLFDPLVEDRCIYAEIPFGLLRYRDQKLYRKILESLSSEEGDYIDGLFKDRCRVYYKMDHKMAGILCKLYEADLYNGKIYQMNSI